MLGTRLHITKYQRHHRTQLLDLTWHSQWTHKHLDWYKTSQWIDRDDVHIFLAWQNEQLVGYLGLSAAIDAITWIRLLGIRDGNMPGAIVRELWQNAESHCLDIGISHVIVLMVTNWLPTYMRNLGFMHLDDIITLNHLGITLPDQPRAPVKIFPAEFEHLPTIARIDRQSFRAPWRLSVRDLRQAIRLASNATIAESAGEIVGYQLSTRHREAGHLARLAVLPAHQGQQIGSVLLHRLLFDFNGRGIHSLSVNTQLSNLPSQRLYQRYGFFRNGFDLELWNKRLPLSVPE